MPSSTNVTVTHRLSSSGINRTFPHILDDKGKPITKSVQFQNFKREFKPIMKALKYSLLCDDSRKVLDEVEWSILNNWLDYFSGVARNEGI